MNERPSQLATQHLPSADTPYKVKITIPVEEYPEVNFQILIAGPRGAFLRRMEAESEAKISLRGEGSRHPNTAYRTESKEMYCVVSAETKEKLQHGERLINEAIEKGTSVAETDVVDVQRHFRPLANPLDIWDIQWRRNREFQEEEEISWRAI